MLSRARRAALAFLCGFAAMAAPAAMAFERGNYAAATFDAAMAAGRPILLETHRLRDTSCPDQWDAVNALESAPSLDGLLVLLIDADTQKAAMRRFGIATDCTLVAFRDGRELARRVGLVDPAGIAAMFSLTPRR
jgi:hypothetical protein